MVGVWIVPLLMSNFSDNKGPQIGRLACTPVSPGLLGDLICVLSLVGNIKVERKVSLFNLAPRHSGFGSFTNIG